MAKKQFIVKHGRDSDPFPTLSYDTLEEAVNMVRSCIAWGHQATLKYRPKKAK